MIFDRIRTIPIGTKIRPDYTVKGLGSLVGKRRLSIWFRIGAAGNLQKKEFAVLNGKLPINTCSAAIR